MRLATSAVCDWSCQPISWRSTASRYARRMRRPWRSAATIEHDTCSVDMTRLPIAM